MAKWLKLYATYTFSTSPNLRYRTTLLVAECLGSRICDQQVAGSNPGCCAAECNPGQVVYTYVPLSPSSIIWYRPMGSDARRLGR